MKKFLKIIIWCRQSTKFNPNHLTWTSLQLFKLTTIMVKTFFYFLLLKDLIVNCSRCTQFNESEIHFILINYLKKQVLYIYTVHKCRSKYLVLEFSESSWKPVSDENCILIDSDIENKTSFQSFSCKYQGVYTVAFVSFC